MPIKRANLSRRVLNFSAVVFQLNRYECVRIEYFKPHTIQLTFELLDIVDALLQGDSLLDLLNEFIFSRQGLGRSTFSHKWSGGTFPTFIGKVDEGWSWRNYRCCVHLGDNGFLRAHQD